MSLLEAGQIVRREVKVPDPVFSPLPRLRGMLTDELKEWVEGGTCIDEEVNMPLSAVDQVGTSIEEVGREPVGELGLLLLEVMRTLSEDRVGIGSEVGGLQSVSRPVGMLAEHLGDMRGQFPPRFPKAPVFLFSKLPLILKALLLEFELLVLELEIEVEC